MQEISGKGRLQISDVRAQVSHIPFHDTDGRLEMRTNGKDIGQHIDKQQRSRGITPGSPEEIRLVIGNHGHRIVAAHNDLAVVHHKGIGYTVKPYHRLAVIYTDGLVCPVGARHDESSEIPLHEQVMERGIGQHDAKGAHMRRHLERDG